MIIITKNINIRFKSAFRAYRLHVLRPFSRFLLKWREVLPCVRNKRSGPLVKCSSEISLALSMVKEVVFLQNRSLSPKLIFCDSGAQSVTLKLFWCIYLLSAVSDDRLHTLIWFSMKGHFNLKTLVHGLAITLRCSSHFKETHERRCLNLLFLAVNNPARVSCPPLGPADQWLTGNHSGLSFQVIDVGPKRCCSVSCLFPGYPLNLRISF